MVHSIVICTANRVEEVRKTLLDLKEKLTDRVRTEILIVNNGRASDTHRLERIAGEALASAGICVRLLHEPRPGVSCARNLALEHVKGTFITMLDDDASPISPGWQINILQVFRHHPQVGICGGPSQLLVPSGCPANPWWRSPATDEAMSCRDGPETGPCPADSLYGLNISYRRAAIGSVRYDERLGWSSAVKIPLAGEETMFNETICSKGWIAWFDRGIPVLHRIQRDRYNAGWLLKRAYITGRTAACFDNGIRSRTIGSRRATVKKMMASLLKLAVRAMQGKGKHAFFHARRFAEAAGYLSASRTGNGHRADQKYEGGAST